MIKSTSYCKTEQKQDYAATITILEHLKDSIFILDDKGKIEYANKSALDLLGLNIFEITSKNIKEFVAVTKDGKNPLTDLIAGQYNEIETEFKAKDYSVPVHLNFGPVKNSEGEINYIIASARDIGWRKEMERVLSQKNMIAMSKNHFKEMGELTVNMVHNLSQPLTSLRLKLELMQKEIAKGSLKKEKLKTHLNKMVELLAVIDSTINNARNFANQTEDESLKIIKVKENLESAFEHLRYEFTENNIQLECDLSTIDQYVMANPLTFQQVFVTLLRMQMKYLANGSGQSAHRKIIISISDNKSRWLGFMITAQSDHEINTYIPEIQEQVIDDSYELDLKVVKMIAESLGGDFNWYPSAQKGLIFSLRIPIDTDDERSQLRNLIELFHDA